MIHIGIKHGVIAAERLGASQEHHRQHPKEGQQEGPQQIIGGLAGRFFIGVQRWQPQPGHLEVLEKVHGVTSAHIINLIIPRFAGKVKKNICKKLGHTIILSIDNIIPTHVGKHIIHSNNSPKFEGKYLFEYSRNFVNILKGPLAYTTILEIPYAQIEYINTKINILLKKEILEIIS